MSEYHAPVSEISPPLSVVGFDALLGKAPFTEVDRDTVEAVLQGAGEFTAGVLAPLNRGGDTKWPTIANGKVTAAPGFKDAYRQYREGGWAGLSVDPKFGGQGLPRAVSLAKFEMVNAANMAFALCPILSEAAMDQLATNGSERQRKLYLPKLVSGEWTGTMIL